LKDTKITVPNSPFPGAKRVLSRLKGGRPVTQDDVRRLENALRSVTRSNQQVMKSLTALAKRIETALAGLDGEDKKRADIFH
jgi:hypothetical protein